MTTAAELRARALRLLALREHSRAELQRKLGAGRRDEPPPEPELIDAVLDALQAAGLLDQRRFAASLVQRRRGKYGDARIARELRTHGLDPQDVAAAMTPEPGTPDELERAVHALRRRHPEPAREATQRARQQRFLLARGFSADVARRAIRRLCLDAGLAAPPQDDAED